MSSAQLDTRPHLFEESPADSANLPVNLKEQVAARLAAHRARRPRAAPAAPAPTSIDSPARARAARIAATVAERYAHSESYRSFLAAEAETALRQAQAAEQAAANARALAAAQLDLLAELSENLSENLTSQAPAHPEPKTPTHHRASTHHTTHKPAPEPSLFQPEAPETPAPPAQPLAGITIRLYEDTPAILPQPHITSQQPSTNLLDPENLALDEEIAFRQSPTFEEIAPPTEIPANLIEFPRQLVAARRARPRRAEGPLLEESASIAAESPQLRIFEVEPTQISDTPAIDSAAPEWSSIMLDAQPVVAPTTVVPEDPDFLPIAAAPLLLTAPLELRLMASAVDACIVLAAMLAFAAAAVLTIGHLPALQLHADTPLATAQIIIAQIAPIALAAGVAFLVLTVLYQVLFFTFADATPGMLYARIGLCTFADDNPTRAQLRRRALTFLLSAIPCGLGLIWCWIDTDRLTWHDRISRIYQRSY